MSHDQSLTVTDATDAEVLPPDAEASVLSVRQTEELSKCQYHLQRLGKKIFGAHVNLIYLYVEAGWWLLRAKESHLANPGFARSEGKFIAQEDTGFIRWFDAQNFSFSIQTARKWMRASTNAGLAVESTLLALQTIRAEKRLHGKTLGALCRKLTDKTEKQAEYYEVTPQEAAADRLANIKENWRKWGEFSTESGIQDQNWAEMGEEERAAICGIAYELYKLTKSSLRKLKPVPTPGKDRPDA